MSHVSTAQTGFTSHWSTWITKEDFTKMASYGLNTVRIPLGYWIVESTVDSSEHLPKGGFAYLKQVCGWARAAGINVILDLHGAPGAQQATQPSTGQYASTPGFYSSTYNYGRAYAFFKNLTTEVHNNPSVFGSVFALEAVNEPVQTTSGVGNMVSTYYPGVLSAVRAAEKALGVSCSSGTRRLARGRHNQRSSAATFSGCLNVQYMNSGWGSGDALKSVGSTAKNVVYDSHQYVKYAGATATRAGYLGFSCKDHPESAKDSPVITGEWSLSVAGDNDVAELSTTASDAATFFHKWGSAQMMAYERGAGWIFWKTDTLNDPRWDYQLAVTNKYLPAIASAWDTTACSGYATS
ncbi:hypothetical protein RQP46_005900 [Phenoliferia psychrophenolica]